MLFLDRNMPLKYGYHFPQYVTMLEKLAFDHDMFYDRNARLQVKMRKIVKEAGL